MPELDLSTVFSISLALFFAVVIPTIIWAKNVSRVGKEITEDITGNGKDKIGVNGKLIKLIKDIDEIDDKVDRLYEWHNVSDADGVKVWYVRQSLEVTIKELSEVLKEINDNNSKLLTTQEKILEKL